MDAAEDRLTVVEQCDERAEEWAGGGEALRAVDRIEHPDELRVGAIVAELLAEHAVRGKPLCDHRAHQLLGAAVGGGHGRLVGLELDGDVVAAEERADEVAAGVGEFEQEGAIGCEVHGAEVAGFGGGVHPKTADDGS